MAERICEYPGCGNLGKPLGGKRRGKRKGLCCRHHNLKYGIVGKKSPSHLRGDWRKNKFEDESVIPISKMPCSRCGWNESYCDRHRLVPRLGYVSGNVVPLCPNCHRIEHKGRFSDRADNQGMATIPIDPRN